MPSLHRIASLLIMWIACGYSYAQSNTLSREACEEDLDTLKSWVESVHPFHLSRISDSLWTSNIARAHSELNDSVSRWDFTLYIGEVLGTLRDSHTGVELDVEYGKCYLRIKYIDEKFYVLEDPLEIVELGSEITAINGLTITHLLETAMKIAPSEGDSYISKLRVCELLLDNVAIEETDLDADSISFTLADGETIIYPLVMEKKPKKKNKVDKEDVIEWVWPEEGEESIVILKVKSFATGKSGRFYRSLSKGFKQLRMIAKRGEDISLVIDLRGNLGGSADRMAMLFNFIIDEEFAAPKAVIIKQCKESKENFDDIYKGVFKWAIDKWEHKIEEFAELKRMAILEIGKTDTLVYKPGLMLFKNKHLGKSCVLIDGLSASGSVAFTSLFDEFNRGPVIGEPCMGPLTGTFANPISRTLPNSQIPVSIATAQFLMVNDYSWSPTPIQPTRWVGHSVEDLISETDPYLKAIKDWIEYPEVSINYSFGNRESSRLLRSLNQRFLLKATGAAI
jgi:hypothetical protein